MIQQRVPHSFWNSSRQLTMHSRRVAARSEAMTREAAVPGA
jgi:hypothetical protein